MKKTVAVAMSGGVDSSLTAAVLQEQGYNVFGVTMTLSDDSREKGGSTAIRDAKRVADELGIEHHVANYHAGFKQDVISYFIDEYAHGRTPNPCVVCNNKIKFGRLLKDCLAMGADYVATGHYARKIVDEKTGRHLIVKAVDKHKDQSYVLYTLDQFAISHFLFPMGDHSKEITRKMAEDRGLVTAHKAESQEICFVPNDDYKAYLKQKAPEIFKPGDIVDVSGKVLGRHEGIPYYTIGQRKGLGIAAEHPLYVIELDVKNNRVIVGGNEDVFAKGLIARDMHFITKDSFDEPFRTSGKIRYGKKEALCTVSPLNGGRDAEIIFDEPQRAVTPGQSVVFYDGDILVGGGRIERAIR